MSEHPASALERPLPLKKREAKGPSQRYAKLCERLDFMPAALVKIEVKRFLFDSEIPLYDLEQVEDYLSRKAARAGKIWGWIALRLCDVEDSDEDVYDELVPESVLLNVERIIKRFPKAIFRVSVIRDDPDPFVAFTIGTSGVFVFAAWDEPGFSG